MKADKAHNVYSGIDTIMEEFLGFDTYEGQGTHGVTGLEKPRYWAALKEKYPEENCLSLESKIDSVIGTAIHERFEKALKESDLPVTTEVKLEGEIAGYSVGGTADLLVWEEPDTCKIYDLKTMKAFPAKKAFNGEDTDKFLKQLSVYAYLLRQQGYNVNPIGSIEVLVVGWTQRDRDLPRTFRIDLPLMSDTEVEEYVKDRIDNISMEKVDCPVEWMCDNYCELKCVCPHYNNKGFENEES